MSRTIARLFPDFAGGRCAVALLMVRIVAGAAFVLHGWPKIQSPFSWLPEQAGMPGVLQALAAVSEFFGGMAWIAGLLTPVAAFGIGCTMTVAVLTHVSRGDPFVGQGGSYEPALVYLCVSILLLLVGPGKLSADWYLWGDRTGGELGHRPQCHARSGK